MTSQGVNQGAAVQQPEHRPSSGRQQIRGDSIGEPVKRPRLLVQCGVCLTHLARQGQHVRPGAESLHRGHTWPPLAELQCHIGARQHQRHWPIFMQCLDRFGCVRQARRSWSSVCSAARRAHAHQCRDSRTKPVDPRWSSWRIEPPGIRPPRMRRPVARRHRPGVCVPLVPIGPDWTSRPGLSLLPVEASDRVVPANAAGRLRRDARGCRRVYRIGGARHTGSSFWSRLASGFGQNAALGIRSDHLQHDTKALRDALAR